jgi:hypothetical protein
VLLTNSREAGRETMREIERLLEILPTADHARKAWESFGEVIVAESDAEMVAHRRRDRQRARAGDDRRSRLFPANMTNYGALFLGNRTNVSYGDKVIGTNHTLPTKKAARYTGGLWVGKFLKTCTYQKVLTDEAAALIGEYCAAGCARSKALPGTANRPTSACAAMAGATCPMPGRRTQRTDAGRDDEMTDLPRTPSFRLDGKRALLSLEPDAASGWLLPPRWPKPGPNGDAGRTHRVRDRGRRRRNRRLATAATLDVTDLAAVREFFADRPAFHVLVNNAGTNRPAPMWE